MSDVSAAVRVSPFSNMGQYLDWMDRNCCHCAYLARHGEPYIPGVCEIYDSLGQAFMADGTIARPIAERMGHEPTRYGWPCPECREVHDDCPRVQTMREEAQP